ncbi:MAG: bifunctional oligoribonuclease/PAP phosphatase NrnA [Desulfohalobium sp.]
MSTPRHFVAQTLKQTDAVLIVSHAHPDGDALGSTAALGWLLQRMGKTVTLYNASAVPEQFEWLPLPGPLRNELPATLPECIVVLDCGDETRVHNDGSFPFPKNRVLNIDHHLGNPEFGHLNWVEPQRSSVGEMIGLLAQDYGIALSGELGACVYLAMTTDTGSFGFSNTGPDTLRLAADIVEAGLDPSRLQAQLQNQLTLPRLHLHGVALQQARTYCRGRLAVVGVSQAMLEATGTTAADCEGLVTAMRNIKGAWAGISLRETPEGSIKFSLRSWGDVDVQAIAAAFSGGGHKNAAGGSLEGPLSTAEAQLIEYIQHAWALAKE